MLDRLIVLIYHANSGCKRTGITFIAYSLHPDVCYARDHISPNPLRFRLLCNMGMIELIFVNPGMKVNGQYYHHVLLSQQMPAIKHVAGDMLSFNNTTLHLTVSRTQLNCYSKKRWTSLVLISGHQTAQT